MSKKLLTYMYAVLIHNKINIEHLIAVNTGYKVKIPRR